MFCLFVLCSVERRSETHAASSALLGPSHAVDDAIEAVYTEDGEWYRAVVQECLPDGSYLVLFSDYGNTQITRSPQIRAKEKLAPTATATRTSTPSSAASGGAPSRLSASRLSGSGGRTPPAAADLLDGSAGDVDALLAVEGERKSPRSGRAVATKSPRAGAPPRVSSAGGAGATAATRTSNKVAATPTPAATRAKVGGTLTAHDTAMLPGATMRDVDGEERFVLRVPFCDADVCIL